MQHAGAGHSGHVPGRAQVHDRVRAPAHALAPGPALADGRDQALGLVPDRGQAPDLARGQDPVLGQERLHLGRRRVQVPVLTPDHVQDRGPVIDRDSQKAQYPLIREYGLRDMVQGLGLRAIYLKLYY